METNKAKTAKVALEIMKELTTEEQISLICGFVNILIDRMGDGEKFQIVQENIKTEEKHKLIFSREKYSEEEEEKKEKKTTKNK